MEAIVGELGGQHGGGVTSKPGGVWIPMVVAVNLHDGGVLRPKGQGRPVYGE